MNRIISCSIVVFLFNLWHTNSLFCCFEKGDLLAVARPVAHLLIEPKILSFDCGRGMVGLRSGDLPAQSDKSGNIDTQVLFGEPLVFLGKEIRVDGIDFVLVAAPWQIKYKVGLGAFFFEGWIEKDDVEEACDFDFNYNAVIASCVRDDSSFQQVSLSVGTFVHKVSRENLCPIQYMQELAPGDIWHQRTWREYDITREGLRLVRMLNEEPGKMSTGRLGKRIARTGLNFLGHPYLWGGASSFGSGALEFPASVDCSGLIKLCYAAAGILIPRDAADQDRFATTLNSFDDLETGDVVFFIDRKSGKEWAHHVALFCGKGEGGGLWFAEAFGCPYHQANSGCKFDRYYVENNARVRLHTAAGLLGNNYALLKSGDIIDGGILSGNAVRFGSLLRSPVLNSREMINECLVQSLLKG